MMVVNSSFYSVSVHAWKVTKIDSPLESVDLTIIGHDGLCSKSKGCVVRSSSPTILNGSPATGLERLYVNF